MRKDIKFKCIICSNEYSSYNKKSKYCSRKCKGEHQKTLIGKDNPAWKGFSNIEKTCEYCGNKFIGNINRKYCSLSCKSKSQDFSNVKHNHKGDKNPRWLGNDIICKCPICNIEFYQRPKKYKRKYCSIICYKKSVSIRLKNGFAAYLNSKIKNISKPQLKLYEIVKEEFKDTELNYPSKGFAIDVAIPSKMIAIEYDGSYWHKDNKKDIRRQSALEKHGWKFLRYIDNVPQKNEILNDIRNII
jgi:hypothetical protein